MTDRQSPAEFTVRSATAADGLGRRVNMRVYDPVGEPITPEVTAIAPGWGTNSEAMHGPATYLARLGHRVATLDHIRADTNDPIGSKAGALGAAVCRASEIFGGEK